MHMHTHVATHLWTNALLHAYKCTYAQMCAHAYTRVSRMRVHVHMCTHTKLNLHIKTNMTAVKMIRSPLNNFIAIIVSRKISGSFCYHNH